MKKLLAFVLMLPLFSAQFARAQFNPGQPPTPGGPGGPPITYEQTEFFTNYTTNAGSVGGKITLIGGGGGGSGSQTPLTNDVNANGFGVTNADLFEVVGDQSTNSLNTFGMTIWDDNLETNVYSALGMYYDNTGITNSLQFDGAGDLIYSVTAPSYEFGSAAFEIFGAELLVTDGVGVFRQGIESQATNVYAGIPHNIGPLGLTNITSRTWRIFGLTGSSINYSNTFTGTKFSIGTIVSPGIFITLNPYECLFGAAMTYSGVVDF